MSFNLFVISSNLLYLGHTSSRLLEVSKRFLWWIYFKPNTTRSKLHIFLLKWCHINSLTVSRQVVMWCWCYFSLFKLIVSQLKCRYSLRTANGLEVSKRFEGYTSHLTLMLLVVTDIFMFQGEVSVINFLCARPACHCRRGRCRGGKIN